MRCIICHVEIVGPEILTLHTRCCKGFIAYNKGHVAYQSASIQNAFELFLSWLHYLLFVVHG